MHRRRSRMVHNKAKSVPGLQRVTLNLRAKARTEFLEGREYYVAPCAMLTVGVHNGSGGSLLYREDELKQAPHLWDHKPIVVYHPKPEDGTACQPSVLNSSKVGILLNTLYDNKLRAEAWFEKARTKEVDIRVYNALEKGEPMEVSTGLFVDAIEEVGDWNGEKYTAVATNLRPDHLAILPDQKGACSLEDGAGLFQLNSEGQTVTAGYVKTRMHLTTNEMSHSNIWSALNRKMRDTLTVGSEVQGWVEDVYDKFFIYSKADKLFRQEYTVSGTDVEIVGDPEEVRRITEYRTVEGAFVGNSTGGQSTGDSEMNRKDIVSRLIANKASGWTEEDREFLEKLEESRFKKIVANAEEAEGDEDEEEGEVEEQQESPPKKTKAKATPAPAAVANQESDEEYLAKAPPSIRAVFNHGLQMLNKQKADAIKVIVANKRNKFTKEQLEAKELPELEALAELARDTQPAQEGFAPAPNYFGAVGAPVSNASNEDDDAPLTTPVMNFEASSK